MSKILVSLIVSAVAIALGACSGQRVEPMTPRANADPSRGGEKIYRRYCGACHGMDAKGDGIVSQLMTPKPRDLTTLRRDFGEFPREWLIRVTDGRRTVRAHGESDMPVWGANLSGDLGNDVSDQEIVTWVTTIVDYLETIQVE